MEYEAALLLLADLFDQLIPHNRRSGLLAILFHQRWPGDEQTRLGLIDWV